MLSDVCRVSISRAWAPHKRMEKLCPHPQGEGEFSPEEARGGPRLHADTQATLLQPQLWGSLTKTNLGVAPGCLLHPSVSEFTSLPDGLAATWLESLIIIALVHSSVERRTLQALF